MNYARPLSGLITVCLMFSLVLGVVGCSTLAPPEFEAVGVREVRQENDRSVIEFTVRATNPNREPVPLKQLVYRVSIGGEVVFSGVRSPEATLHTFSSQEFNLPAVLPAGTLKDRAAVPYALVGSASYIPPGRLAEVLFDADIDVPAVGFEFSGTIDTSE